MCGNIRTGQPCGEGRRGQQDTTLAARFWAKVDRKSPSECWLWLADANYPDHRGYGKFSVDGRSVRAHRVAYELEVGPIPAGKLVLHRCDVRRCVNPSHLFLGTHSDNAQDAYRKGRRTNPHRLGRLYPGVSPDAIRLIRRAGFRSSASLAEDLGLSEVLVRAIRNGRSVVQAERIGL